MAENKAVEEFGNVLAQMSGLKPPGVSGSKIKSLTEISVENVQSESILIQKLYTHFKKTPGTHKLGVLYAVDSIVRAYIDEARKAGQDPTQEGPDGTFSAGVHRITGLLSSLMNDIMIHAPEDTKEKIKKLMDIWQRGSTFPADLINSIRSKHFSSSPQQSPATDNTFPNASLPFSNPPASQPVAQSDPASAPNTAAILQALAQMSKSNATSTPTPAAAPITSQPPSQIPNFAGLTSASATPAPSALPVSLANFGAQPQPTATAANLQSLLPGLLGGNFGAPPQPTPPAQQPPFQNLGLTPQDPNVMTQLALLQMLTQGLGQNQLAQALEQAKLPGQPYNQAWQQPAPPNPYERYDERRGDPFSPGRDRFRRSRSRSPVYGDEPPVRRRSPVYGEYSGNGGNDGRERDYSKRGGRGNRGGGNSARGGYRRDRSASPQRQQDLWDTRSHPPPGQKFVEYDESLKPDRIRVYSRTLFVGGVSSSEQELRQLFQQHGEVQSCIVNFEKRHAFIKMKTRGDAVRAKEALETHRLPHSVLRTRWGVGFGPRDCCDYATGISEIALDRLTDADRRWLQTAEYGGIGDRPIEGGLVLEEPDIEIGQGVSSKAISRRMQTDHAGARGPKSSFQRYDRDNSNNYDNGNRRDYNGGPDRDINTEVPITASVPGFGGFGGGYAPLIYQQPGQQ